MDNVRLGQPLALLFNPATTPLENSFLPLK